MRGRGSGLQGIYLLSRGFKFIINCSDCNWLQTVLSNYSQTLLFYLLLLKVKLHYGILKNVILSQLWIIFHWGFLIFLKWLETGCLFHKKNPERAKRKAKRGGSSSVAGEFETVWRKQPLPSRASKSFCCWKSAVENKAFKGGSLQSSSRWASAFHPYHLSAGFWSSAYPGLVAVLPLLGPQRSRPCTADPLLSRFCSAELPGSWGTCLHAFPLQDRALRLSY